MTKIFSNFSCTDLERSAHWYRTVFERDADQNPMEGLLEWHFAAAGFQLFQGAENAGRGTVTIMVDDVRAERKRLSGDPDGNLVVLAQQGHV